MRRNTKHKETSKKLITYNGAENRDQNNSSKNKPPTTTESLSHTAFRKIILKSCSQSGSAVAKVMSDENLWQVRSPCYGILRPKSTPVGIGLINRVPGLMDSDQQPKWSFSKLSFPSCPLPPACPHVSISRRGKSREKSKLHRRKKMQNNYISQVEKKTKTKVKSEASAPCYDRGYSQGSTQSPPRNLSSNINIRPRNSSSNINILPRNSSINIDSLPRNSSSNINSRPRNLSSNINSRPRNLSSNRNIRPSNLSSNRNSRCITSRSKSISKKKRFSSVTKSKNLEQKRRCGKKSSNKTKSEKIDRSDTVERRDTVQRDLTNLARAEQNAAEIMGTEEDSSSIDSVSETRKRTHKIWAVDNKVVKGIEAVRIEGSPAPLQGKKNKKKKYRAKVVRAAPRVSRNLGAKTEKVAREQARVAVEELCRQASVVMNSISPPLISRSPSPSPSLSTSLMTHQFREKLDQGKGKHKITSSRISVVSYPSSKLIDTPSLQAIPRTYQQLGLAPLERSPSSQNFFPKMAPFLRGEEGNIPLVRSPPKPRESRRDRHATTSQSIGQQRAERHYFDSDTSRSPSTRTNPRACVSCVHPKVCVSCVQPRKLKLSKNISGNTWGRANPIRQTLVPLYRDRL